MLYQTAWFSKVIILMFAAALGIAISVLQLLPAEIKEFVDRRTLRAFTKFYCIVVGDCTLVLVIFIFICLTIHLSLSRLPSWLQGWIQLFEQLDKKKQLIIQRGLWTAVIGSLIAAVMMFNRDVYESIFHH